MDIHLQKQQQHSHLVPYSMHYETKLVVVAVWVVVGMMTLPATHIPSSKRPTYFLAARDVVAGGGCVGNLLWWQRWLDRWDDNNLLTMLTRF